jgi:ABC-type Mn2+/Zn2+ transport system ATPase subunit
VLCPSDRVCLWEHDAVSTLELQGITKRYGRRNPWVLAGASLSLEPGDLMSILGANGSGKSTLLRIAAGVTSPSGGTAQIPDRVGYVPEKVAARCPFTSAGYLAQMGRIRGLRDDQIARDGRALLDRLGLRPRHDVPWSTLSKGNRQKVVLAQAFLGRPDLIVLDEPYSGLDLHARDALDELIARARGAGSSVLASSHDAPWATTGALHIVDGHLDHYDTVGPPSRTPMVLRRVELTRQGHLPSEATPAPSRDTLTQRDGVVRWHSDSHGTRLVLDVDIEASDDLIRSALDLGWSVDSVRPASPSGRADPS